MYSHNCYLDFSMFIVLFHLYDSNQTHEVSHAAMCLSIFRTPFSTLQETLLGPYVYNYNVPFITTTSLPPIIPHDFVVSVGLHSTKKPVTSMLTYPWKCTVLHCNHLGKHLETTLADDLASARAIIKVSGHQHQWFPGVSQVVTM